MMENIISSPPTLPVKRPATVTIEPPKPPLPPGVKPVVASAIAPPKRPTSIPTTPMVPTKEQRIARHREALAEAGTGDPESTAAMLMTAAKNTAKSIPLLVKKYWWLGLILAAGWLLLSIWEPISLARRFPSLAGLIKVVTPLVGLIIMLTAAYNNWFARSIYALIVLKVGIPLFNRIKGEGLGKVLSSFGNVVPGIKASWAQCGGGSIAFYVMFLGVGLALSNFLTRNNSSDKVIVAIAMAITLVKTLSDGKKAMPFMASRVISKDLFRLLKMNNWVTNDHIYLAIGGVMTGLLGSIVLMFTRSLPRGDFLGFYLGAAAFVAGIVLYFVKAKTKTKVIPAT